MVTPFIPPSTTTPNKNIKEPEPIRGESLVPQELLQLAHEGDASAKRQVQLKYEQLLGTYENQFDEAMQWEPDQGVLSRRLRKVFGKSDRYDRLVQMQRRKRAQPALSGIQSTLAQMRMLNEPGDLEKSILGKVADYQLSEEEERQDREQRQNWVNRMNPALRQMYAPGQLEAYVQTGKKEFALPPDEIARQTDEYKRQYEHMKAINEAVKAGAGGFTALEGEYGAAARAGSVEARRIEAAKLQKERMPTPLTYKQAADLLTDEAWKFLSETFVGELQYNDDGTPKMITRKSEGFGGIETTTTVQARSYTPEQYKVAKDAAAKMFPEALALVPNFMEQEGLEIEDPVLESVRKKVKKRRAGSSDSKPE